MAEDLERKRLAHFRSPTPTPTLQLWQTVATWGHLPAVPNASDFPEKLIMGFLPEIVCFFGVGN